MKRTTVKDVLPIGTWVITPNGAGEVTAANNRQATVSGIFRAPRRFGDVSLTWDDTLTIDGLVEARSIRPANETQARAAMDAERAAQAEAQAEVDRRLTVAAQAAQRRRLLNEIGRRLEALDADGLDRLERALSDIAPVLEVL